MWTMTATTILWPPQKLVGPLWEATKEERLGKLESRSKSVEHCSQEYIFLEEMVVQYYLKVGRG